MALSQTVLQIGDEFRALQETRVKTYASLQEAHKAYLKTAPDYDFKVYQKEVAKATDAFNDISQQIIGLQTELGDSELAPFVSQVRLLLLFNFVVVEPHPYTVKSRVLTRPVL